MERNKAMEEKKKEDELPICPECAIVTEQDELDMFGGYCESCFEDLAD